MSALKDQYIEEVEAMAEEHGCEPDDLEQWQQHTDVNVRSRKMANSTKIWDALGKTDPKQTKRFTRAGGFKGTSVKPIYMDHKMTQQFGPCGVGWGISEPQYQLVNGAEGEVIVYCWLSVWFRDGEEKSEPVPGIGGDFAVKKTQRGLISDDEAFKKATTDAIGNAVKHLGMAADVHMGQHDDDKYVAELQQELHGQNQPAPKQGNAKPVTGGYGLQELQRKLKELSAEINAWETVQEHDNFMSRQDVMEIFRQAERDLPQWMNGDGKDKKGIYGLIQQRLDEVREYDPTGGYSDWQAPLAAGPDEGDGENHPQSGS